MSTPHCICGHWAHEHEQLAPSGKKRCIVKGCGCMNFTDQPDKAPPPPCTCGHWKHEHAANGPCVVSGCGCLHYEIEPSKVTCTCGHTEGEHVQGGLCMAEGCNCTNFDTFPGQATVFTSQAAFARWADQTLDTVTKLLRAKGKQYSAGKDAFENFKAGASQLNMTPEQYLMTQAEKHWYTLCQWSAGLRPNTKHADIAERMHDIIVYMLLLEKMSEEDEHAA